MGSLFTKLFLSFWLTAMLLGGSLYALESWWRGSGLEQTQQRLAAHADTVATLLAENDQAALQRWLAEPGGSERRPLWLLDGDERPVAGPPLRAGLVQYLQENGVKPGIQRLKRGLFLVAVAVPGTSMTLLTVVHPRNVHHVPATARFTLAILASGLVSLGLAVLLTRRIRRLRKAAQGLAAGDLGVRVDLPGHDEVAALGRDFNIMAERVVSLLDAQRQLLRDVSHELRSPLARLKVALELARKNDDPTRALERIEREADRLEGLIAEVISLARLETGQAELRREALDLSALVEEVVRDADFEAQARSCRVALTAERGVNVTGDPRLLRSAVENVVRNAVRHTAPETAVAVNIAVSGDRVQVTVQDQGPGVPVDQLTRIFEPFARIGEARDRRSGGFGLGLAISRRVMEAHGGRIWAENVAGGGLRLTLSLPAKSATA